MKSCGVKECRKAGNFLTVLKPIRQHAQGDCLCLGNGIFPARTVSEYPGERWNFGDLASILLALKFDTEHGSISDQGRSAA